jgi:signal peptidase I
MKSFNLSSTLGASLSLSAETSMKDAKTLVTVSNRNGEKSVLITSRGMRVVDSADYVLAPKERTVAKRRPIKHALQVSTKVTGWVLVSFMLTFGLASVTGLIDSRVVLTGSMQPAINPGDIVVSTSPDHVSPKVGDVVIYSGKKFDGTEVASFAHRIIAGDAVNGFTVKGDNNPDPDVQKPRMADIEGVVLFTAPMVGKLLTPQMLIVLLLIAFGIWLLVDAFREEE